MLSDKIYQMFITGTGKNLEEFISKGLGGVIFFSRDITSEKQFIQLIADIKGQYSPEFPQPFLSIDQEGGRVERTENLRQKRFLSPKFAFKKGENFLSVQTDEMLTEISNYGINMNFAPCLDVNTNPNNPIIGERAFSDNPSDVCKGWDIVYPIYKKIGIIPVIKHFPGHGDASKDSHKELPEIDLSLAEMEANHIAPFKYAIKNGAEVVMVAHLHCKCFDKVKVPTSLSKNCIEYIRKNLGFKGVLISDDMYMKGLSDYSMSEACIKGIKAGLNMFIYRDASDETLEVIENLIRTAENDIELREKITASYERIIRLKSNWA